MSIYNCPLCNKKTFHLTHLLKHIGLYHQHEPHFHITCGLNGCSYTSSCFNSYRSHVYRKHKVLLKRHNSVDRQHLENDLGSQIEEEDEHLPCDSVQTETMIKSCNLSHEELIEGLKKSLCLFILKIREKHTVPAVVQKSVVEDLRTLCDTFITHYKEAISFHLTNNRIHIEDDHELQVLLDNGMFFEQCIRSISSEWMLEQYCVQELDMIQPTEICLDKQENGKIISFQYIPLLALLQKLAKNKDVWAALNRVQSENNEILTDFTDGEMFKSNRNMTFDSLRLNFYLDEFEVVNPLGSKRGKHKLTAVYFKLGNLDHKDTSKMQNIYLSTLVHHRFLKKDLTSYAEVLQPLITDLAVLETTGVMLSCDGESRLFNGTVASVSADNLSAHAVAGLTRSFSTGRVCRFCLATANDIKAKFTEEEFTLRNAVNYRYHLNAVEEDSANSSVYGITNACCFSNLNQVPSPILHLFPPDIMHDIHEGILPMVLSQSISQWLKDKYFALSDLNYEIENLPYGKNDLSSKPVPLSDRALKSGRLGGSAMQNLTLFRLLPFMIGDQIPETDRVWKLYLLLREIVDIVLAPQIRRSWIPYLSEKITEFLSTFNQHFPEKITPKMHYLIHYPRLILLYGPLVHLSRLRFEAKHQYFKRVATVLGNFKNISKTLARRHQFRQCWEQTDTDCLGITAKTADTRYIPVQALPTDVYDALMSQTHSLPFTVSKTTYICVNNVAYHVGDFIIVNTAHTEEVPVFLEIQGLYCVNTTWLLCGKVFTPSHFDSHLHSYVVEEKWQSVVKPGEEIGYHCLDGYRKSDGQISVPLRHWITVSTSY